MIHLRKIFYGLIIALLICLPVTFLISLILLDFGWISGVILGLVAIYSLGHSYVEFEEQQKEETNDE